MHHETCERTDYIHDQRYGPRTFPEVSPLESLGPEGDEAWDRLTTSSGGFLWLQYNETYDIPWGISMFHGTHCLQMLRQEFQSQLGISNGGGHHHQKRNIATKHDGHNSGPDIVHLGHCLAYVVQMLQCTGDSTIERPWIKLDELTGDLIDHGVDGAGIQHQCRDVNHIWAAAEATERKAAPMWDHKPGDTVEMVFGDLRV
ncbi:hypothetical protein MMC27_008799 [Xylographa pallens]|nr:hypothetical protein [Xylographa pallens]